MRTIGRRRFLETAAAFSALAAWGPRGAAAAGTPKKSVLITMLPKELPFADRFKLAVDVGFAGIEMQTVTDPKSADEIKAAAEASGLRIHSVMNSEHWRSPISSPDPEVVNKSVAGMETSLRNAKLWGADAVLLVPAVVGPETSYQDAWTRSQKVIRERILPLAQELKVIVAVEEVWNKFLLSPLEFVRYVDEFQSPWLKAYFDVGNVVFYAYPQDWIRTLGKRIVRVHLKDFQLDRPGGKFFWKNIGEGDIDWVEVRKALGEIGYDGYVTTEIAGGDAAYLKDVVARLDRFLAGQKPVTVRIAGVVQIGVNGNTPSALIVVRELAKTYHRGSEEVHVLQGVNLTIDKGEFVAFMGPSGSGKTTLLNLIGGLDLPTAGSVTVAGDEITRLAGKRLTTWRARHVGFVFQMYNLIPVLSAYRNVELPLLLAPLSKAERRKHVETALSVVGVKDRMQHKPAELSGGQQQRVSIARAIVADPTFLLCDEPTGDLDRKSADEILELLERLVDEFGKTVLMVTHDPRAAERAHATLHLDKGVLTT